MSYYAKIVDGFVVDVISVDESVVSNLEGFWLKTSYNTRGNVHYGQDGKPDGGIALRANYAGIGYTYDEVNDVFIPPKPYSDWVLDTSTYLWIPPIPEPKGGGYYWDQPTHTWLPIISSAG